MPFAAAAAGVGVLALATPAEGKVVYTPDNQQIPYGAGGAALYLDLNHDGINDFSFFNFFSSTSFILGLSISPVNASNEIFSTGRGNVFSVFAAALPVRRRVGPEGKFEKQAGLGMANDDSFSPSCQGPWVNANEKYLGLKFLIDGEVHYGWARLNVHCVALHPVHAAITGYAYETVANQSIITGDTRSEAGAVVKPPPGSRIKA